MPSVTYDYIPNQTVWVITANGVESGVVSRLQIDVLGTGTTVTYYVLLDGDTAVTAVDESAVYGNCQATAGYQQVDFGDTIVAANIAYVSAGSPLGSPIGSPVPYLIAQITIDTTNIVPVFISSIGVYTYQDIIDAINGELGVLGTAEIVNGNIVVTSATTGTTSNVTIADTDFFNSLTGYVQIDAAVDGLGAGAVEAYAATIC